MQFPAKTTLEVLRSGTQGEIQNGLLKITVSRGKKKKENEYQSVVENKKESKASICVKLPGKEKKHVTEAVGSSYKK